MLVIRVGRAALLGLAASLAPACGSSADVWFQEGARESGLDFVHVRALEQRFWFPEIMGGGVALLDFDQDGWLDLYLVQSGDLAEPGPERGDRLYRNQGDGSFRFVEGSGAEDPGYGMGCACADADGDGKTDLFVTNVGPNTLYRNRHGQGSGPVFEDVTAAAGVGDPAWGTSASFFDADSDGDLDLFVTNYVRWSAEIEIDCRSPFDEPDYCAPNNYDAPTRDLLYRNEGDGRFTDVSEAAGLSAAFGNGLGVVTGDLDQDGRIDVYVANDLMPNQLWINRGELVFADRALYAGCAVNMDGIAQAGMGIVAVDVEGDFDLDVFITHLREETNTLFMNEKGLFSDHTAQFALGAASLPYTGFGTDVADFDHDGVLDVFVANGAVTRNRVRFDPDDPYAEPVLFQRGVAAGALGVSFVEVPGGGSDPPSIGNGRGAAFGDLDNDGDLDVVVVDNGARVRLLENLRGANGHWIQLSVLERTGADALGAQVLLEGGGKTFRRDVQSDGSYCAASDPRVHVGLGASSSALTASVRWVDGASEEFGPLETDRFHVLRRGEGQLASR